MVRDQWDNGIEMSSSSTLRLKGKWIDSAKFEESLACSGIGDQIRPRLRIVIPTDCSIMVDAGVRLLSWANQLVSRGIEVCFVFEGESNAAMGYLDRIGFFQHLLPEVRVEPEPPSISGSDIYRGRNSELVEIHAISTEHTSRDLPSRLSKSLACRYPSEEFARRLEVATFTVLSELIDNVSRHSQTDLSGFVTLQTYKNGGKVQLAVSDSGLGLLETLRPTLSRELQQLEDSGLIREMFNSGLSRLGSESGCGLTACAGHARRFNAILDLRLSNRRFVMAPDRIRPDSSSNLVHLAGTHICFNFQLDSQS